jgi:hypothetical protein
MMVRGRVDWPRALVRLLGWLAAPGKASRAGEDARRRSIFRVERLVRTRHIERASSAHYMPQGLCCMNGFFLPHLVGDMLLNPQHIGSMQQSLPQLRFP